MPRGTLGEKELERGSLWPGSLGTKGDGFRQAVASPSLTLP